MTEKPHTPDSPRKPDLRAFGQAVRFRDQATRVAVAHHERCGLPPSGQYARATFDAISELIREDERARMVADGWQRPESECGRSLGDPAGYEIVARRLHLGERGQLVSGVVVASAVSDAATLGEAIGELRRAVGAVANERAEGMS